MAPTILVITSNIEEQVHLLLLLIAANYHPTCCDSLPSALTALADTRYDLILTDAVILDAPPQKMAAVEFTSLLKETSGNSSTPVLVTGAMISLQHIMDTLRSGVARFIPKPFTSSELLETIAAELNLSAHLKTRSAGIEFQHHAKTL